MHWWNSNIASNKLSLWWVLLGASKDGRISRARTYTYSGYAQYSILPVKWCNWFSSTMLLLVYNLKPPLSFKYVTITVKSNFQWCGLRNLSWMLMHTSLVGSMFYQTTSERERRFYMEYDSLMQGSTIANRFVHFNIISKLHCSFSYRAYAMIRWVIGKVTYGHEDALWNLEMSFSFAFTRGNR